MHQIMAAGALTRPRELGRGRDAQARRDGLRGHPHRVEARERQFTGACGHAGVQQDLLIAGRRIPTGRRLGSREEGRHQSGVQVDD